MEVDNFIENTTKILYLKKKIKDIKNESIIYRKIDIINIVEEIYKIFHNNFKNKNIEENLSLISEGTINSIVFIIDKNIPKYEKKKYLDDISILYGKMILKYGFDVYKSNGIKEVKGYFLKQTLLNYNVLKLFKIIYETTGETYVFERIDSLYVNFKQAAESFNKMYPSEKSFFENIITKHIDMFLPYIDIYTVEEIYNFKDYKKTIKEENLKFTFDRLN